ncbi:MAG: putative transposase [bacterium]
MNIQPVLTGGKGVATDLSLVASYSTNSLLVFMDTALLERVPASPECLQYKLLGGRMVNMGFRMCKLREAFPHDPRTLKRWGEAAVCDDVDEAARLLRGRGADGKLTPVLVGFIKRRYRALRSAKYRNFRQIIAEEVLDYYEVTLSGETLRKVFREADREDETAAEEQALAPVEMSTGCASDENPSSNEPSSRNQSPEISAIEQVPFGQSVQSARPQPVHHAGLVLFSLLFELFCRCRPFAKGVQTQWLGQILQGAVNIERSRLITAEDLAVFTGPVVAGTQPQRKALDRIAGPKCTMDIYAANNRLLPNGPGRGTRYYYDPHSKELTGELKTLKDWCGSRHGVAKAMHLDCIHTESGLPCFVQHYSPYYDLRERFFMTLEQFDELFPENMRAGRLFVLDRGIFGLSTFERFRERGDYFLTWEKGYRRDGWDGRAPEIVFERRRVRNDSGDLRAHYFECREEPWRRDPSVRRILVRATNPQGRTIKVAILCSDPDIDVQSAVWLMFNRWLQENNFKYLDLHFGLDQLTSYLSRAIAEEAGNFRDQPVDSPEYKELKKQEKKKQNELGRELVKREKLLDELAKTDADLEELRVRRVRLADRISAHLERLNRASSSALARLRARGRELDAEDDDLRRRTAQSQRKKAASRRKLATVDSRIEPIKEALEDLDSRLSAAVREQSRLRLLINNHYRLYDTRRKETLDALRITASNMFAHLMSTFRPLYDNCRNDHVMLRNLTRADGFLRRQDDTVHVELWLKGRFEPAQIRCFEHFLKEIGDRINDHLPPHHDRIRIALHTPRPRI